MILDDERRNKMSYYVEDLPCGCQVEIDVDDIGCMGHGPDEYCYCYDYSDGVRELSIKYCSTHGG